MLSRKSFVAVLSILVLSLMISVLPAFAHEGREVGDYLLTFGWRVEPALVGIANGPELSIAHHDEHEGEEGDHEHADEAEEETLEVSLQIEVSFGPATRTMAMRPVWGETGHYVADLIPTRPGDYTFRIFGTIGDLEVDETFASSDGAFSGVEPASDVMFPDDIPSMVDLLARLESLEALVAELQGGE